MSDPTLHNQADPNRAGISSPLKDADDTFFYTSPENAGRYDQIVEFVVPEYRLMHETMTALLKESFRRRDSGQIDSTVPDRFILDIGSGTGADSLRLMQQLSGIKVVAIDRSPAMNDIFRRAHDAAFPGVDIDSQIRFIEGDVLDEAGEPSLLSSVLEDFSGGSAKQFDAVVTALTVHHFQAAEKHDVYRRSCEVLKPGCLFLNGDLFSYDSAELSQVAHEFDIRWIRDHFSAAANAASESELVVDASAPNSPDYARVAMEWERHYEEDNVLQSAEDQQRMLRDVGFGQTAVPFRFWQVGVLWAVK